MSANQYYGGPPQGGQGGPQYPQQSFNGQKGAPNYGGYQQPYGQPPMNQNWQGGKLLAIPCGAMAAVRRCFSPLEGRRWQACTSNADGLRLFPLQDLNKEGTMDHRRVNMDSRDSSLSTSSKVLRAARLALVAWDAVLLAAVSIRGMYRFCNRPLTEHCIRTHHTAVFAGW